MKMLSPHAAAVLQQPRYSIKVPNSFQIGNGDQWVTNLSVLSPGTSGHMEVAYPSYNTKPTRADDKEALAALLELTTLVEASMKDIYIEPGDYIIWNNSLIVHRRGKIGDGPRLLYRNYSRGNCDAMRSATGTMGPIFSARALLSAVVEMVEGACDVG